MNQHLAKRPTRLPGGRARARSTPNMANANRSQAAILRRQRQIVIDRDVELMTWPAIAVKHKIDEDAARNAYYGHVNEIVPLVYEEPAPQKAVEYLRTPEGLRERLQREANDPSPMVRIQAIHEIRALIQDETILRQNLGMMPRKMSNLRLMVAQQWTGEFLAAALEKLGRRRINLRRSPTCSRAAVNRKRCSTSSDSLTQRRRPPYSRLQPGKSIFPLTAAQIALVDEMRKLIGTDELSEQTRRLFGSAEIRRTRLTAFRGDCSA